MTPSIVTGDRLVPPAEDEVLVVRRPIVVDDATRARLAATLAPAEESRAARYVFEHDRRASVVSRGTLRTVLGELLGRAPASLGFVAATHGKPALVDGAIEFNVSHTSTWLDIAVSPGRVLGTDIEGGGRPLDVDELAPTVFTRAERAELSTYEGPDRTHAFLRGWTRKEAYVKVLGTGLTMPLADFSVSLGREPYVSLTTHAVPAAAREHLIVDLPAPDAHAAALAWSRTARDVARITLVLLG